MNSDNEDARHTEGGPDIGKFRSRHLTLGKSTIETELGRVDVTIDEAESPLIWLARRRGRDGRPLIESHQFLAGERLRADFTRGQLMPRTTANWESPISRGRRGAPGGSFSELTVAARQRLRRALDAAGPEFSGLLLDVCCFLKALTDVERERQWPARSAKVILQLGLERLARHYGLQAKTQGAARGKIQSWIETTEPGE